MKISVLTPTYNRAKMLDRLYVSLIINSNNCNSEIEWLIMDDGSTDETEKVIRQYTMERIIEVKYFKQENQGKMKALNNLMKHVTGEYLIECDSDDYLANNAIKTIEQTIKENEKIKNIYAYAFLKYDQNGENMGNDFPEDGHQSTMFDLYFKEEVTGEKALVYKTRIRKDYEYEVEDGEKFITEASLHHELDLKYNVLCFNKKVMICEYKDDGYSNNILKIFYRNPKGYYKYFKDMFYQDLTGVTPGKKWYMYKQYIMFSVLSKSRTWFKDIDGVGNKIIVLLLYVPGAIATKMKFKKVKTAMVQEKLDEIRAERQKREENKKSVRELIDTDLYDDEVYNFGINIDEYEEDTEEESKKSLLEKLKSKKDKITANSKNKRKSSRKRDNDDDEEDDDYDEEDGEV